MFQIGKKVVQKASLLGLYICSISYQIQCQGLFKNKICDIYVLTFNLPVLKTMIVMYFIPL